MGSGIESNTGATLSGSTRTSVDTMPLLRPIGMSCSVALNPRVSLSVPLAGCGKPGSGMYFRLFITWLTWLSVPRKFRAPGPAGAL